MWNQGAQAEKARQKEAGWQGDRKGEGTAAKTDLPLDTQSQPIKPFVKGK